MPGKPAASSSASVPRTPSRAIPAPRLTKREQARLEEERRRQDAEKHKLGAGKLSDLAAQSGLGLHGGDLQSVGDLNDEFLRNLQSDPSLSKLAKEAGMVDDGKVLKLRSHQAGRPPEYVQPPSTPARGTPNNALKGSAASASAASSAGGSPSVSQAGQKRTNAEMQANYASTTITASAPSGAAAAAALAAKSSKNARLPPMPKTPDSKKKKKRTARAGPSDKINKGLRHFSMKVCRKVEEKGTTNYNEVADELVKEFIQSAEAKTEQGYDEKNIRRRVYDALNVLLAMDIISREKKEIRWRGLPSNAEHDLEVLKREKAARLKNIEKKKQHLRELLVQHIAFQNLVARNNTQNQSFSDEDGKIHLPFIVVSTDSSTTIQCEMSEDRQDIFFNFSAPFEINDDYEVLRCMGQQYTTPEVARSMVPERFHQYIPTDIYHKG